MREFVRIFKDQLEDKAEIAIDTSEVLMLWLIRWAAMVSSRYLVGKDGMTAYERRRGRRCRVPVLPFGEKLWYKELRDGKERKNKLSSEWAEGIWLGHSRGSNEAIIGTRDGVVRAYALKRMAADHRWDRDLLRAIRGTPQQPDPSRPGLKIPVKITFEPPREELIVPTARDTETGKVRRMMITPAMLDKYGYTEGCDGCRTKRAGLKERRGHTEECRARIEAAMAEDSEDKGRWERNKERLDRRMAEHLEKKEEEIKKQERTQAAADGSQQVGMEEDMKPAADESGDQRGPREVGEMEAAVAASAAAAAAPAAAVTADLASRKRDIAAGDKEEPGKRRRGSSGDRQQAAEAEQKTSTPVTSASTTSMDIEMTGVVEQLMRVSVDIAEMYSPPRITEEAQRFGLKPGEAMDLSTGWDFSKVEDRNKAWRYLHEKQPKLVIGSPMCTMFSTLQFLSRWTEEKTRTW